MTETLKIKDEDSGEMIEQEICLSCNGAGGYDASTDCEEYDDWQNCSECDGAGYVELGHFDRDVFDPKRDALTPND